MIERITDISNDLCDFVDDRSNIVNTTELIRVYEYHRGKSHIHPLTNWHAHRIRCMSAIAARLSDKVRIWECHFWILKFYYHLSRCPCHCRNKPEGLNHDFFHRDSISYFIYGSQALVNAAIYLHPFTKYRYHTELFQPILLYLTPFTKKEKTHLEYVHSEIPADKKKSEFGKPWNPIHANTFLRLSDRLKTMK